MTARKKRPYTWLLTAGILVAAALLVISTLVKQQFASTEEGSLSGQIQAAASYEATFQKEPEEPPAPGALKIPIILYHSIRKIDESHPPLIRDYEVAPEALEAQLKYLKDNGYTAISLDQVAADLKIGTTLPILKPVVLTFDDGWENQYRNAFPLLKKYGMTATFYVPTGTIGTKHHFTWDELKEMQAAGMSIEDHSVTHPLFKTLSLAQIKWEVTASKNTLEKNLGAKVVHFASPYGSWASTTMEIVKNTGYETYRTTYKGVYQDNPLRLRSILMTDDLTYFIKELNQ